MATRGTGETPNISTLQPSSEALRGAEGGGVPATSQDTTSGTQGCWGEWASKGGRGGEGKLKKTKRKL